MNFIDNFTVVETTDFWWLRWIKVLRLSTARCVKQSSTQKHQDVMASGTSKLFIKTENWLNFYVYSTPIGWTFLASPRCDGHAGAKWSVMERPSSFQGIPKNILTALDSSFQDRCWHHFSAGNPSTIILFHSASKHGIPSLRSPKHMHQQKMMPMMRPKTNSMTPSRKPLTASHITTSYLLGGWFQCAIMGDSRWWLAHMMNTINETPLILFCVANRLVIKNTYFDRKRIHKATWKDPGSGYENEIDYIWASSHWSSTIRDVNAWLGVDINCDHHLLLAECQPHLKCLPLYPQCPCPFNVRRLAETCRDKSSGVVVATSETVLSKREPKPNRQPTGMTLFFWIGQ